MDKSTTQSMISALPDAPGCYIYRDSAGDCLYVGKSKQVRSRVRSYFNSNNPSKVQKLAKLINRIEYRPTTSEIDALYLEHGLIKTYRPPFNSQMKKDPHPHYICIEWDRDRPGLYISDRPTRDAERYGGFNSVYDAREALTIINRTWATPICESRHFDTSPKTRGCLNLHIGRCIGPCQKNLLNATNYRENLLKAAAFMQGRNKQALLALKREMNQAATDCDYEKAANLRDTLDQLSNLQRRFTYRVPFIGRRLCVLIKGYHEPGFLLLYYNSGKLQQALQLATPTEWIERRDDFVSSIFATENNFNNIEEQNKLYSSTATSEIRARKLYINITKTPKPNLAAKLNKAIAKFIPKR